MQHQILPVEIAQRLPWGWDSKDAPIELPQAFHPLIGSNDELDPQTPAFVQEYRASLSSPTGTQNAPATPHPSKATRIKRRICDAICSPLRRMPAELLREIFLFTASNKPQRGQVLSRVCRRWRNVALSLPQFWSYFEAEFDDDDETAFDNVMERFSTHVKRSGQTLLDISVRSEDKEGQPVDDFHRFLDTILSDPNIASRVASLSMELPEGTHHNYHHPRFSLPNLRTLVIHDGPLEFDFEIKFGDNHLTDYEERIKRYYNRRSNPEDSLKIDPEWMSSFFPTSDEDPDPDESASAANDATDRPVRIPALKMVSLDSDAFKSLYRSNKEPTWSHLTHLFLQPVMSEHGWWHLMGECDSLVMGWFNVTQLWDEHDSRSPRTWGSSDVEDLTVAFVDYGEPSQHCLETLSDSIFPCLKTLALHINESWDTHCGPVSIQDSTPEVEKICLPRSWSMRGRHWKFLETFSNLRHLELGIRLSRLGRSLKVLTLPTSPVKKPASFDGKASPNPNVANTESKDDDEKEADNKDEDEDEDKEDEDEDEDEEDDRDADRYGHLSRGPPKQPFLPHLNTLVLEINDLTPAGHIPRNLFLRHVELFVAMVESRTNEDTISSHNATRLERLEISFMVPSIKRTRSYAYMWTDGEESSDEGDDEGAKGDQKQDSTGKGDQEDEAGEDDDNESVVPNRTKPAEHTQTRTILDVVEEKLRPYIENGGLSLDVGFRVHARSSYGEKWKEAQSSL